MHSTRSPWPLLLVVAGCTSEVASSIERPDAGPALEECTAPGYYVDAQKIAVTHVSATVVDENGTPVPKMVAQACGVNVCVPGATDDRGTVVIDTNTMELRPAFKYGNGRTHARVARPLTGTSSISVDLGDQTTVAFDPPERGATIKAGAVASSRDIVLELPANLNPVKPDPFDFDTVDLKKFRAAVFPPGALSDVEGGLGFELVVALTPSDTVLCPAAKLTVPNSPAWPAGSQVEVHLHGTDVLEEWAPYGGWAKVSDATVSEDGATISTVEGGGIPALSLVGFRLAP